MRCHPPSHGPWNVESPELEATQLTASGACGSKYCPWDFLAAARVGGCCLFSGLPCSSNGKESACNAGDLGLIPGSGRSSGERHGNPQECSCLENPMDRGAWWATVRGIAKSQTWLTNTDILLIQMKLPVSHHLSLLVSYSLVIFSLFVLC